MIAPPLEKFEIIPLCDECGKGIRKFCDLILNKWYCEVCALKMDIKNLEEIIKKGILAQGKAQSNELNAARRL